MLTKANIIALTKSIIAGLCRENNGTYLSGDVVCVHDFNSMFYPVMFQAIIGAGGCFTGTNPAYTESELDHHFRKSKTKYIITTEDHLDRVRAAAKVCGIADTDIFLFDYDETFLLVEGGLTERNSPVAADSAYGSVPGSPVSQHDNPDSGFRRFRELLLHGQRNWQTLNADEACSTPAALFSTSGTSGLPKLAVRTHANLVTEGVAIQNMQKPYKPIRLLCVPFFHAFASPLGNILAMREGVPTFVMARFNERDFLDAVERYEVTETALVPPVIVKWLANASEARRRQLQSVRVVWCGGAPMDGEVQDKAIDQILSPQARIVQVWGLTECGWLTTFHHPERDSTGSVGRALPNYQIELVDDRGQRVRRGRGELVARSASTMQGYLNDEHATANAFMRGGWYRTGDVGEIRKGKVYIVDRKKELIKVRGWQVAPAELEATLLRHEQIVDAAVIEITVKADSGEEVPEAHVVRAPGSQLTAEEVRAFLLQYLARYKVVDCRVVFCNGIPKSASGKILRKMLRARERG